MSGKYRFQGTWLVKIEYISFLLVKLHSTTSCIPQCKLQSATQVDAQGLVLLLHQILDLPVLLLALETVGGLTPDRLISNPTNHEKSTPPKNGQMRARHASADGGGRNADGQRVGVHKGEIPKGREAWAIGGRGEMVMALLEAEYLGRDADEDFANAQQTAALLVGGRTDPSGTAP